MLHRLLINRQIISPSYRPLRVHIVSPGNTSRSLLYLSSDVRTTQRQTRTYCQPAAPAATKVTPKSNPKPKAKMAKKKSSTPPEHHLLLPTPPSTLPIVDTHTHIQSTFDFYRTRYKEGKFTDVYEMARGFYEGREVEAVVDVWCEAPVREGWRKFADAGKEKWGFEYWFVMGVHPHEAKSYTDDVEKQILEAMAHPRCVGWGEIGLDYHYDLSPREIQQEVFTRQLRHAIKLGKPLTIHTREADADTERILKAEVPKEHPIHIHCFTDTPQFAQNLLDHFPNLFIGITGVITYVTNTDTSTVVRNMMGIPSPTPASTPASEPTTTSSSTSTSTDPAASPAPTSDPTPPPAPAPASTTSSSTPPTQKPIHLRILLETDAPYMVPANLYSSLPTIEKGKKLPICHTGMVPWTAQFVADLSNVEGNEGEEGKWTADEVMRDARENARRMYGI